MPGSNARALEKARGIPVDAVVLDLEDSVAPDAKAAARQLVKSTVSMGGYGRRELVIRLNGPDTIWFEDDLLAAIEAAPDAILIPKVSSAETLSRLGQRLADVGAAPALRVWAMIETPRAILDIADLAGAARDPLTRLACLVLGTNDLAKETRARLVPGRAPMIPWLTSAVLAARSQGLDVIDGVYNALDDDDGFRAECEQGRDMGFDGKTLIHPRQVGIANTVFAPNDDEIAWARSVLSAFAEPHNASKGAIQLEGRMVERLHATMAERVVALAAAIRD